MGLIYVISLIAILIIFMLIKKSDKELNGLGIFGLGIVLILCYNVFECYVLNFFRIKLTLLNLSIVNFTLIFLGIIYLYRKKTIQKYIVNLKDLIFAFLIGISVIVIGGIQYEYPLNIKFETTDPAVHYRATVLFAENESLLNNVKDDIYNFRSFKIGSYVNSGLLMKITSNYMDEYDRYKIFIIFDLFILFLTGYMLYFTFIKISKGKLSFIAFILALLCMLGYPLNSMCFGFEYLNVALLIMCTIINMVSYYKNKEIDLKQCIVIFFLLNFEFFCTYYLFVPFTYSALFIYFCIDGYKNDKRLFTKKTMSILIITLIIPFILGFIYHLKPDFYSPNLIEYGEGVVTSPVASVGGLVSEGYIYKNLYSNIILLLPLTLYVLFKERKEFNFSTIMFVFIFGYMSLLFLGFMFNKVSGYYIAKNYFALWILLFYFNFKGLYYLYEKNKKAPYILCFLYIIILIISFNLFDFEKIKNTFKNTRNLCVSEVYNVNKYLIFDTKADIYIWENELLKYAKDNLDKNKKIEILGNEQQIMWAYDLLDYISYYKEMDRLGHQEKLRFKYMNNEVIENADYIICFYRSNFYRNYDKTLLENKEVIYENVFGKIIKNN